MLSNPSVQVTRVPSDSLRRLKSRGGLRPDTAGADIFLPVPRRMLSQAARNSGDAGRMISISADLRHPAGQHTAFPVYSTRETISVPCIIISVRTSSEPDGEESGRGLIQYCAGPQFSISSRALLPLRFLVRTSLITPLSK